MKNLRQVFLAIIIALASIGLLLGGFSLSLAEGNMTTTLAPAHTLTPTSSPTWQPFTPSADSPTPSPTWIPTLTFTLTPTLTPSLPPTPTNCPPPVGWVPYIVQSGDTLDKLVTRYHISSVELQQANCLLTTGLLPGVLIFVPPIPTQTPVPVPCGPPYSWIAYIVQPGDTLYHLSLAYGITVAELQRANCMGNSNLLHTGQKLYVPPWAPHTPSPTPPSPATPTGTLTNTPGPSLPSDTPTDTFIPTASDTPIEVPTETPTPIAT